MPIKPENAARYPANWAEIREQTLARAGYRCQWPGCGARHHAVGYWEGEQFVQIALRGDLASLNAEAADTAQRHQRKVILLVLTIAHLDHTPENCAPQNLRAWCQRHHLRYDVDHHRCTAYMTRRERATTRELFPIGGA